MSRAQAKKLGLAQPSQPARGKLGPADLLRLQIEESALPPPVQEHTFAPPRRWRFDLAWPALMVAVEVDGGTWTQGRHTRGSGYELDCEKLNRAAALGWRVLRYTTSMVRDGRAIAEITSVVGGE